ncbi:MAG: hypothetical protein AAFR53_14475 [Pseudomonadota bacterium]
MFEVATTQAHRDAIARAHAERAAVFAAGLSWVKSFFGTKPARTAPVASAA